VSQNINQYPRQNWGVRLVLEANDITLVSDEENYNQEVVFSPYLIAQTYGNRLPFYFDINDTTSVQPISLSYKQYNFNNVFVSKNYYNPDNIDLFCLTANTSCDIGLTGTDNGLVTGMTGQTITFTNGINDFTKFDRLSFDRRLKMFQVTGYTSSNFRFSGFNKPILYEVVSKTGTTGTYHELYGGFYQGFYKLFGYDYEIFPERMNKGWAVEMLLKPRLINEYTPTSGETTLNQLYPENKNIFFYMGTRAENKYYHHADGFMGGISGYTRITSDLTLLETCACCNTGVTNSRCIYVYPPRSANGEHDPHHNYGCNTCGCNSTTNVCTSCGCNIEPNEICGWECKSHSCESSVQSTCETDPIFDSMSNAISFKLCGSPNNPAIGVKVLRFTGDCVTTGTCATTGITYQTGYTVTEYCSPVGIYDFCANINPAYLEEEHWFQLDAVWERYTWLDTCDLWYRGGLGDITERRYLESLANNTVSLIGPPYTQVGYPEPGQVELVNLNEKWLLEKDLRKGRLKIYVNGKRFFTIENFEEIIPRGLNTDKEKQVGVPFNISWGGGTQGLRENLIPKPTPICDITYGVVVGLTLSAIVLPGSVNVIYDLTSSSPINQDIVVEFTNTLGKTNGDIIITTGVTINANSTTGQSVITVNDNYFDLNQTSVFDNILINGVETNGSFNFSSNTSFNIQAVAYTADTLTNFANPERGFYKPKETTTSSFTLLNLNSLINQRVNEGLTLIHRMIYLDTFKTSLISQQILDNIQTDFDTMRTAGVKCVLRFAYSTDTTPGNRDTTKFRIEQHINQLSSYLQSNSDVIFCMQAGFIGTYGEWYYSDHFGTGTLTPQNLQDRQEVLEHLENNYGGFVQVRTPLIKTNMFGLDALSGFNSTYTGRTGHHNDCFVSSETDFGTYTDKAVQYPYLAQETLYVPIGGETCAVDPPRSECFTATSEMEYFHYTYLNNGYNPDVLASWSGCIDTITLRLGHRLRLVSSTYLNGVLNVILDNDGYAGLYNERDVYLVLRNVNTLSETTILATEDIRTTLIFNIPVIASSGTYDLFLWLPDKNLDTRVEYSIRMANIGTWEVSTGYNDLLLSIVIP
jgi:hypothetical protein